MLPRRMLLLAPPASLVATAARSQTADPRLGERAVGRPDARVTCLEHFSLTCGHCAAFHRDTWPRVKSELVDTGRVRMVFRDFPLDQLALQAAMVARALPAERYEGFLSVLFATQERWAFSRGGEPLAELARLAAVAGLSRAEVDAAATDQALARGIIEARAQAEREFRIASTPTFVIGRRVVPGAVPFDRFAALVAEA
jgi:protein-disulfide isomerase